jgi:hypothetical protein
LTKSKFDELSLTEKCTQLLLNAFSKVKNWTKLLTTLQNWQTVRSRQKEGRQADIETDKKEETQTDTRIMLENILFN